MAKKGLRFEDAYFGGRSDFTLFVLLGRVQGEGWVLQL